MNINSHQAARGLTLVPQTVSVLGTFILAMTLYLDVQQKAQDELDRIFEGQFPDFFADEGDISKRLPYINAIVTVKSSKLLHLVSFKITPFDFFF